MEIAYIDQFKAQSPFSIIEIIFKEKRETKIALTFKNGTYVEGYVVDILKEEYQTFVCMKTEDNEVLFFNFQEISLLSIKQPKALAVELSKGTVSRPISNESGISVLELKRWIQKQQEILEIPIDFTLSKTDLQEGNVRLNCKDLITDFLQAVEIICKDALALEVWKTIEKIIITQAEEFKIIKQENNLEIYINTQKALPKNLVSLLVEKTESIL
ncbi:hypothetical protein LXD69_17630 [Flavobacterium sediminilitoris]|uniref:Uncharacterized protein n=1 Tax=Flavobacterium sediminilitoris TaxID=2024526 RepID=A0ABY4HNK0_9FLAO|nr:MULTISPECIES: hypothetical protein [Flavobacterium]UOX33841.1 hypothetical protein LXD69_17630 [Flavobacterium sediminilitoris]